MSMLPFVSVAAGAALLAAATRVALPPAAWVAIALILRGTRSLGVAAGAVCLWGALFAALALTRRGIVPAALPLYCAIVAAETTLMVLPFVLDRVAGTRLPAFTATLILPAAMVVIELARLHLTPAATWGSIAGTQYGFLPLMQLASVTGIWGITFLVSWTASVAETAIRHGVGSADARAPALACLAVLTIAIGAGVWRVAFAPVPARTMRAAALNRPADLFRPGEMTRITEGRIDDPVEARRTLARLQDAFLDGARREARAGATLVVWPEQNLLVLAPDEAAFLARAEQLAAEEQVYLAIGIGAIHPGDPRPFENKLVLVGPRGDLLLEHLKTRPVFGWEASIIRKGTAAPRTVTTPAGRIAGAICFEADFPQVIRAASGGRADLLVLPANDWPAIKDAHLELHVYRAIENGVAILRAGASGLSAAIDPYGRVLAVADYFAPGDRTLVAQVPIGHVATAYERWGDWFAWMCVALLAGCLLQALLQGR